MRLQAVEQDPLATVNGGLEHVGNVPMALAGEGGGMNSVLPAHAENGRQEGNVQQRVDETVFHGEVDKVLFRRPEGERGRCQLTTR